MTKERLKQFQVITDLKELKDNKDIMMKEIKDFMTTDKDFMKYARKIAEAKQKNNVGIIDLFEMLELIENYLTKNDKYKEFLEANKPAKEDKKETPKKVEPKPEPKKEVKDIFSLF